MNWASTPKSVAAFCKPSQAFWLKLASSIPPTSDAMPTFRTGAAAVGASVGAAVGASVGGTVGWTTTASVGPAVGTAVGPQATTNDTIISATRVANIHF